MRLKTILTGVLALFLMLGVNTQELDASPQQLPFDTVTSINYFSDVWGVRFTANAPVLNTDEFSFFIPASNFHVVSRGGVESNITFLDSSSNILDVFTFTSFDAGFISLNLVDDIALNIAEIASITIDIVQSYSAPPAGYIAFLATESYYSLITPNIARFFYNQHLVKQASFIDFLPVPPNIVVPQGSDITWLDANGNVVNFNLIVNKDVDLFGALDTEVITWTFIVNDAVYDTRQFAFGTVTNENNLPDDPQLAGLFFYYWYIETRLGDFEFNIQNRPVVSSRTLIARFESTAPADASRPPVLEAPTGATMGGIEAFFTTWGIYDDSGLSFVFMITLIILNVSLVFFKLGVSFIVIMDLAIMGLFAILGLIPAWGIFVFSTIGMVALILLNGRGVNYE